MPKQGYRQTAEHKAKIREGVKASWANVPSRAAQQGVANLTTESIRHALPGTVPEIATRTGLPHNTVRGRLGRMYRADEIARRQVRGRGGIGSALEYYVEGKA